MHELQDIESLNRRALSGELEITAVSVHAYAHIADKYAFLSSGSSMGDGYGPRLVARTPAPGDPRAALKGRKVGIPGTLTTAWLALQLYQPDVEAVVLPFDEIEDAVARGDVEVGLLIHEGQLTFQDQGLHLWEDLGVWWMRETGLPLPLGGNVVRRDLGAERHQPGGPRPPREHRVRPRAPQGSAGARQPLQPRHRGGAHRHLRGHVRERVDGGLRPARPRRRCRRCSIGHSPPA